MFGLPVERGDDEQGDVLVAFLDQVGVLALLWLMAFGFVCIDILLTNFIASILHGSDI